MENTPTPPELPEAIRIDYAPPSTRVTGWWWRVVVAVVCTICLAIGSGAMAASALSRSSGDAPIFAAIGVGFLVAGIGLPLMIFVAKRL